MTAIQSTLQKMLDHTSALDNVQVRRIVILYDEKIEMLGDCCIRFDKFRYLKLFFGNAAITVNYTHPENFKYFDGLLKNNPYVEQITTLPWDRIDFGRFDLVLCVMYDEERFLRFAHDKYGDQIRSGAFRLAAGSLSSIVLDRERNGNYLFPAGPDMVSYLQIKRSGSLYITGEEQQWANRWLEAKGVREYEHVFILLDASAVRSKLMHINVYFELLAYLLGMKNTKILIFDEKSAGKEDFYREYMGLENKGFDKIIFSKSLSLRQDLCLIGSRYTKMVFGPCTGLMHCASSIYNHYVNTGMDVNQVPLLITYTGRYGNENYNVPLWWGSSPLVQCVLLKERNHKKELCTLDSLTEEEKRNYSALPCDEYTAQMFIDFINGRLKPGAVLEEYA